MKVRALFFFFNTFTMASVPMWPHSFRMKVFALFIVVVHFTMALGAILAFNEGVSSICIIINFTKALEPWWPHSFIINQSMCSFVDLCSYFSKWGFEFALWLRAHFFMSRIHFFINI